MLGEVNLLYAGFRFRFPVPVVFVPVFIPINPLIPTNPLFPELVPIPIFVSHDSGSSGAGGGSKEELPNYDCGLRAISGNQKIPLGCEPFGILTSPLRIAKNGNIYGIILVDPANPLAAKFKIKTSSGIKAFVDLNKLQYRNTSGEGNLGESCDNWLTRTGQAGIIGSTPRALVDYQLRVVNGSCIYRCTGTATLITSSNDCGGDGHGVVKPSNFISEITIPVSSSNCLYYGDQGCGQLDNVGLTQVLK